MTDESVEKFAELLRRALMGKVLKVTELHHFTDYDEVTTLPGAFVVELHETAGTPDDLHQWWSDGRYTPRWWADVNGDERRFWCCPVTFERATGKWSVNFEEVEFETTARRVYRVDMSGMARMRGTYHAEAANEEEAGAEALRHIGDVDWRYDGMDDDTVEVDGVSGE